MFKVTKRKVAAIGVACGTVLAAGVAFAAWTSTGTGNGTGSAREAVDSVIATVTPAALLYPGIDSSLIVSITNPNPYPVQVTSIEASSSMLTAGGCAAGTVYTDLKDDTEAATIAPSGIQNYTLRVRMLGDAQDVCQGEAFVIPLTANLQSVAVNAP